MGEIVSEFTCVEFSIDADYENKPYDDAIAEVTAKLEAIKAVIHDSDFSDFFNLVAGSNGNVYFTAAPSGSKEGWATSRSHSADLDRVCKLIEFYSNHYIKNTTVTSAG